MNDKPPQHIIIDQSPGEIRVAVLELGRLSNIYLEREHQSSLRGALILGKLQAVKKELNAVFLDLGHVVGYLEGIPKSLPAEGGSLLVEVLSEPRGNKGARVTDKFMIAGILVDINPNESGYAISRAIKSKGKRAAIRELLYDLVPKDIGAFVKSTALNSDMQGLEEELKELLSSWERIQSEIKLGGQPKMIKPSPKLVKLTSGYDENTIIEKGKNGLLFDKFNIDVQISNALEPIIKIKGGIVLIFEEMEALTAIDIDLASFKTAQSHPRELAETLAKEIFWQIRLRKLSGVILIDYPRAKSLREREHFFEKLKKIASRDESNITIHGWTRTGLLEVTKKRLEPSLREIFISKNSSQKPLVEISALEALRKLITNSLGIAEPQLVCARELKTAFMGPLRRALDEVNGQLGVSVDFQVDPNLSHEEFYIHAKKRKKNEKQ